MSRHRSSGKARFDAAIIGAGAAGLAAAEMLTRAGTRVVILEARDRIGGRIHTVRDPALSMPIELGAEFIHGQPDELMQIVRRANLPAYDAEGEHWHLERRRLHKLDDAWEQIERVMGRLPGRGSGDRTFLQFLRQSCNRPSQKHTRDLAIGFVEGFDAAPADRISAVALAKAQKSSDESGGLRSLRLLSGYDSLVEHLHRAIDPGVSSIRLRTVVTRIDWRKGEVSIRVRGPQGEPREDVRAACAIITLPLGVLQAPPDALGAVQFHPQISEKQAAAQQLAMGPVVKIIIKFSRPFWEQDKIRTVARGESLQQMAFLHSARIPFATWWTLYPVRSTILVGWAGGPSSDSLTGKSDRQILAAAMESLSRMLGLKPPAIEQMIEKYWVYDWQSDPFARGAYSFVPVGAIDAVSMLAEPIEGTLFFAGEATDDKSFGGTVDSAVSTGRRAAREVLKSLSARADRS